MKRIVSNALECTGDLISNIITIGLDEPGSAIEVQHPPSRYSAMTGIQFISLPCATADVLKVKSTIKRFAINANIVANSRNRKRPPLRSDCTLRT